MFFRGHKINANFFCTKFFKNPLGHGRPRQKMRFSAAPVMGRNLLTPGSSGRKGRECPREIRTEKFMFMLFFSSLTKPIMASLLQDLLKLARSCSHNHTNFLVYRSTGNYYTLNSENNF